MLSERYLIRKFDRGPGAEMREIAQQMGLGDEALAISEVPSALNLTH